MSLMPSTAQDDGSRTKHGHRLDAGLTLFIAYFFCITALTSFHYTKNLGSRVFAESLTILLVFVCAVAATLLSCGLWGSGLHTPQRRKLYCGTSGIMMSLGFIALQLELCLPQALDITGWTIVECIGLVLSGCGYGLSLILWGALMSSKSPNASSRLVLADTSTAAVILVIFMMIPRQWGPGFIAMLGLSSGLIFSWVQNIPLESKNPCLPVVSQDLIPFSNYVVSGLYWMIYGVFWTLLDGQQFFSGHIKIMVLSFVFVLAAASLLVARSHQSRPLDLSKAFWISLPLFSSGAVFFLYGDSILLQLASVTTVFSLIISYLYFMSHFAMLGNRPYIPPHHIFAWGWLGPHIGMALGIVCGLLGDYGHSPFGKFVLPLMIGLLVATVILTMLNFNKMSSRSKTGSSQADKTGALLQKPTDDFYQKLGLTSREQEVFDLLLQGRSQAVIAEQISVAKSTVNTHVKHIYRKAGVNSKQELIDLFQKENAHDPGTQQ